MFLIMQLEIYKHAYHSFDNKLYALDKQNHEGIYSYMIAHNISTPNKQDQKI